MNEFELGDVVKLRSGSPSMTVCDLKKDEKYLMVSCKFWCTEKAEFQIQTFLSQTLFLEFKVRKEREELS